MLKAPAKKGASSTLELACRHNCDKHYISLTVAESEAVTNRFANNRFVNIVATSLMPILTPRDWTS